MPGLRANTSVSPEQTSIPVLKPCNASVLGGGSSQNCVLVFDVR